MVHKPFQQDLVGASSAISPRFFPSALRNVKGRFFVAPEGQPQRVRPALAISPHPQDGSYLEIASCVGVMDGDCWHFKAKQPTHLQVKPVFLLLEKIRLNWFIQLCETSKILRKKWVSITSKNQGIFMKFIRGRQEFKFLLKFLQVPPHEVEEDPNQTWASLERAQ